MGRRPTFDSVSTPLPAADAGGQTGDRQPISGKMRQKFMSVPSLRHSWPAVPPPPASALLWWSMGVLDIRGLQSTLFFESPEEIYARVFRELKPRTAAPEMRVEFCRFANADSFIRLKDARLEIRISDLLAGAPAPVLEALAHILLGKLYRKPIAPIYAHRYRLYLNRRDVRRRSTSIAGMSAARRTWSSRFAVASSSPAPKASISIWRWSSSA